MEQDRPYEMLEALGVIPYTSQEQIYTCALVARTESFSLASLNPRRCRRFVMINDWQIFEQILSEDAVVCLRQLAE